MFSSTPELWEYLFIYTSPYSKKDLFLINLKFLES